jgi:tRNA(Ile)-lysidine synthase
MRTSLHRRIRETLKQRHLLAPGDHLGIGVSGGADSVALLRLLHDLQEELGVRLTVLHFQHRLRGAESVADEEFTAQLAARLGVEFLRDEAPVADWACEHGVNLEEAGRQLRTEFFERTAREARVTRVATAHTADDQAETVLAHLLRGSGLAGLAGIYPQSGVVIRPLLDIPRAELRDWLHSIGQPWCEDATNADTTRLRACLRQRLLPVIEREYQPRIADQLCRLAALAREEEQFGGALAQARFSQLSERRGAAVALRAADLLAPLPATLLADAGPQTALARRMVRCAVEAVLGHRRGLTAKHVEDVLHLAGAPMSGKHVELPHGVRAERSFREIVFTAGNPAGRRARLMEQESRAYSYSVDLPECGISEVIVPAIGRLLRLKVVDWRGGAGETRESDSALDAGRLRSPLLLRNWRPGDVFCPRGRHQGRKLKELLREARVPAGERVLWPVVECCGKVVWVRGLPADAACAAGSETRRALLISEEAL